MSDQLDMQLCRMEKKRRRRSRKRRRSRSLDTSRVFCCWLRRLFFAALLRLYLDYNFRTSIPEYRCHRTAIGRRMPRLRIVGQLQRQKLPAIGVQALVMPLPRLLLNAFLLLTEVLPAVLIVHPLPRLPGLSVNSLNILGAML